MSDQETSEADTPVRWLLVGFVVTMLLVIGLTALLYQPKRPDPICSRTEARCGDSQSAGAQ
jgi:hypothetical protein